MSDYTLGTARGVIRLEFQDAGTKPAEQAVNNLAGSGEKAASRVMSAISGAAAAVTAAVVATSTALAISVVKTGVAYNTLEQTSRAAFKTILGSAEAAEEMMGKIREFGKTSPFPRQAFIEATQQMLGFGYAADDVIPILETINDATAALGGNAETVAQFSNIFSKIKSNAKISGEEVARFGDIGIDAVTMLADAAGVTGEEMRKRISEGAVGAEEAITALTNGMREKFGGAAENVKETWAGAVDRIKGAWRDLASEIMQPFVSREGGGALVGFANSIADALRGLIPLAETLSEWLGPKLEKALAGPTKALSGITESGIVEFFADVKKSVEGTEGALAAVSVGLLAVSGSALAGIPVIGPMFSALAGPVGLVIAALAGMITESEDLRNALKRVLDSGGEIGEILAPIFKTLGTIFSEVLEIGGDMLAKVIEAALPALVSVLTILAPVLEIFGLLLEALMPIIVPLLETALMPLISILEGLTPILELVGQGLQWVADRLTEWSDEAKDSTDKAGEAFSFFSDDTISSVQTVIDWIVENWPTIQQTFENVWNTITEIWGGIVEFFTPLVEGLMDLWTSLRDTATEVWEGLQASAQTFMDWWNENVGPILESGLQVLQDKFGELRDVASEVWTKMEESGQIFVDWWIETVNPILEEKMEELGDKFTETGDDIEIAWQNMQNTVGPIVAWFQEHVVPVIAQAMELVGKVTNLTLQSIGVWWEEAKTNVTRKAQEINEGIARNFAPIFGMVQKFFGPVFDAMTEPIDRALAEISKVKSSVEGFFSGAGEWLKNAGREIIGGLIRGLEEMLGNLRAKLAEITNLIPDNKGPIEKDRILLKPAGESIMEGLITGLMSQVPALKSALSGITVGIPEYASANISSSSRIVSEMIPTGYYEEERASSTVHEEVNNFGDIIIPLEDLESIKNLEEFLEMIRVYKRQGGR